MEKIRKEDLSYLTQRDRAEEFLTERNLPTPEEVKKLSEKFKLKTDQYNMPISMQKEAEDLLRRVSIPLFSHFVWFSLPVGVKQFQSGWKLQIPWPGGRGNFWAQ